MTRPAGEPVPIAIRDKLSADLPYIASSWRLSYAAQPAMAGVDSSWYHAVMGPLLERLLEGPGSLVRVAVDPTMPDLIIGWICGAPADRLLHYVFCKGQGLRKGKVATRLLADLFGELGEPIRTTFYTPALRYLLTSTRRWNFEAAHPALLDIMAPNRPRARKDRSWQTSGRSSA